MWHLHHLYMMLNMHAVRACCNDRAGSMAPRRMCGAMGCILYELCTLRKAFDAGNLGAITIKIMRWVQSSIASFRVCLRLTTLARMHT